MRQNTRTSSAPLAALARPIFSTSASQSTANSRTPSSSARKTSRSFFIVLPNEIRSGVAPAASASSISTTEAASKHEPSSARRLNTSGAGFALTA
jgi:hypothetical protein